MSKPNPYDRIYVTTIDSTTFLFEDAFGSSQLKIYSPTVGQAIENFISKFPQTANRYFQID